MPITERIFLSPPHMSGLEMEFVKQAFQSNYIAPLGPMVEAFEKEFAHQVQSRHALAVSSGTAAMHLAMRVLGVGPGDLVVASTLTFIGSVTPILFQGAIPIFIDSDPKTWNLDPFLLEEALEICAKCNRIPKAVVPTDLYGQCADYDRIKDVCDGYGIPVIIDSAESLGATYRGRPAGSRAYAAVYSFNGNKILTTSGGGMLVSNDGDFIEKARFLSQQARDPAPHYEHSEWGYNYRMSNILAAIGRGQLRVLEDRVRQKRQIFELYRGLLSGIPGISFMPEAPYGRCSRWLTVILIDQEAFGADREAVRLALEKKNIESRPVWKPMHLQKVFEVQRDLSSLDSTRRLSPLIKSSTTGALMAWKERGRWPAFAVGGKVSEALFQKGLCLPSGTALTEEKVQEIVTIILSTRGNPGNITQGKK